MSSEIKKQPEIGVHNVPFLEYVGWDALNWSTLKNYRLSAKHGRYAQLFHKPDPTDDLRFGDAFHASILEPGRFAKQYVSMPRFEGHPNSNAHKEAKAAWIEQNKTMVHLTTDEMESLTSMGKSVAEHPVVGPIIRAKGKNELSIAWDDEEYDIRMKARLDRLCRFKYGIIKPTAPNADIDVLCICDFKSTKSIEPDSFVRDVVRYGYHGQAAYYLDGLSAIESAPMVFLLIAVEKEPPYDCVPYLLPDDVLDDGRALYRRLLSLKINCEKENRYPGVAETGAVPLFLPRWAKEEVMNVA